MLKLEGNHFRFHGTNNDMLYRAPVWYIDRVFATAKEAGLKVLRIMTVDVGPNAHSCYIGDCRGDRYPFMTAPGEFNEDAFSGMDRAIAKASEFGVRLVISFVNNWGDSGMDQFVAWSDTAEEHEDFYTDSRCKSMYKSFVEAFLTRTNTYTGIEYRDDPTVLMWELANEPQAPGNQDPAPDKLQSWIEEMAPFIKSIDPNHLLSTGGHGYYLDKLYGQDIGESFIENNSVREIDMCSMHMYPKHWGGDRTDVDDWNDIDIQSLRTHIRDAQEEINKPFYLGEFSPQTRVDRRKANWQESDEKRARIFERWYTVLSELTATGALHWSWYPPMDHNTDAVDGRENLDDYNNPYATYPKDIHTMSVIRRYSEELGWLE